MNLGLIQENLQVAVSYQAARKFDEAAEIYESILEADDTQSDALHLLGLVESQRGNHERAIALIGKATELVPDNAVFWSNFGVILRQANRTDEALAAYERSIELDANSPDSHFNYGKSLRAVGKLKQAEEHLKKSIALNPKKVPAWLSLMNLASSVGKSDVALAIGSQALGHVPEDPGILLNSGIILKREKNYEPAIEYFHRVLAVSPEHVEALCKLAAIDIDWHHFDDARDKLDKAMKSEPDNLHVLNTLGLLNNTIGDHKRAIAVLERAVSIYPNDSTAFANLGTAFKKSGELTTALKMMTRSFQIDPKGRENLINLAGAQLSLGMISEAAEVFRKIVHADKGNRNAHDSLLMCMQYDPSMSAKDILAEHQKWNDVYAQPVKRQVLANAARAKRKPVRIGFVSPDLGMHPVGYFSMELFKNIDPTKAELFVYSDRTGSDDFSSQIASLTTWNDVAALNDEQLTAKIAEDEIDILFDLAGHTAHNRLLVFARRAAPIQISWAGYVGTTGLGEMDYLLGDSWHLPEGCEEFYSEKLLRMPNGYVTFTTIDDAPDVGGLPALENGYVTFGAMCNPAKVNATVLHCWGEILRSVNNSKLVLCYKGWEDPGNQQRVMEGLGTGIDSSNVTFTSRGGPREIFELYNEIDIALDTFPYSGGLTTCEALWMGVPTITNPSDKFAGRHSLSHLSNVGLGQFVAADPSDYCLKAGSWSKQEQLGELSSIRSGLRARVKDSPLCGGEQFANDFLGLLMPLIESKLPAE